MASIILVLIFLAYISLGLPDSLTGAGWPEMYEVLGCEVSSLGILTMIIAGCTIASAIHADLLNRKFGTIMVISSSTLIVGAAMLGFGFATKFWVLCLLAIPYGLGAGAIDSAVGNYVALHYSARVMNFVHAFWGIGAIISPYIMSYAILYKSNYTVGYKIVAIIQLSLAALFFLSIPLWKKEEKVDKPEVEQANLKFFDKFKIPGVVFLFIGFFAESTLEATFISWTPTYCVLAKGVDSDVAASLSAIYFIGLVSARFISGFLAKKVNDRNLIRLGSAVLFIGLVMMALPISSTVFTYITFAVVGLGVGPIWPAVIHSTPFNFGKQNSQAIIGLENAFAYTGTTFMPPIYGLLAQYVSAASLPYFIFFFFLIFVVMIEFLNKVVSKKYKKELTSSEAKL